MIINCFIIEPISKLHDIYNKQNSRKWDEQTKWWNKWKYRIIKDDECFEKLVSNNKFKSWWETTKCSIKKLKWLNINFTHPISQYIYSFQIELNGQLKYFITISVT